MKNLLSFVISNIAVIFISLFSLTTWGATYYVSPNGSDSNVGSLSAPFSSLMKAHNSANPGDTIYLRGGIYNISEGINLTRGGSSGNPITVMPYLDEKPVLDASGIKTVDTWVIHLNGGASWWHIKGLEIRNNPNGGGIYLGNDSIHNNIIENNNIHHNGFSSQWAASGISVYGLPSNNLFLNNDIHHNRDIDGGDADGISAGNLGSGNVYRGNRAWNNSDDGFDFFCVVNNAQCATVVLENNWSFDNGYDANHVPLGNGSGFKLGGKRFATTGKSGGHTLRNNLAWSNLAVGFDDNLSSSTDSESMPLTLYNNTSWANGENYSMSHTMHSLVNNLSYGKLGFIAKTYANNSWTLSQSVTDADFSSLNDSCARGPRKPDGSLPDCQFLHLTANSILINKGVDVGIAFSGSAPDMGAFEYSTNSNPVSLPDVIVTSVAYNSSTGMFTSVVKNQGSVATPAGVYVGVSYSVDGTYRTWGSVMGPLAAGASITIGTGGGAYFIPQGTHTITVFADDALRFNESDENNNKLSTVVSISGASLPDVVVTSVTYNSSTGMFTSVVKNQGSMATPAGVYVGVSYSVDGAYRTWGGVLGPLAAGASITIGTGGGAYFIPQGTHTITVYADDALRFNESDESNNKLSQSITVP